MEENVTSALVSTPSDAVTSEVAGVTSALAAVVTSLVTTILAEMTSQPTTQSGSFVVYHISRRREMHFIEAFEVLRKILIYFITYYYVLFYYVFDV